MFMNNNNTIDILLSKWEQKFNNKEEVIENCHRCRKPRPIISFFDKHQRRRLCNVCREYNKIYCRKYFKEIKDLNKKIDS